MFQSHPGEISLFVDVEEVAAVCLLGVLVGLFIEIVSKLSSLLAVGGCISKEVYIQLLGLSSGDRLISSTDDI